MRSATGGDINPGCLAGVFAPSSFTGGPIAGRRFLPCPHFPLLRTVLALYGLLGIGLRFTKPFPIPPVSFLPDDED